ncbi:MAG TPA: hypothetical protein VN893_02965 [Bryobacteraceae bacterium]|nr:hypothetical protein [Bryobacteraceae bacterium]
MTGRQIGAVAGIILGAIGCMKADRVVADQWLPFSAPTLVTGLVSDTTGARGPSLTGDELELYLSCQQAGETDFHIWVSTRTSRDAAWSPAPLVPEPISSAYNEQDPDVSPDGLTIYFASDRSGAGYQIYSSRRTVRGQPWGDPTLISELGSSTLDVRGPSVDPSGLFMIFCSAPQGTEDFSLYSASRTGPTKSWGNVQALSGINSDMADADPALFHDSLSLIWSSRAPTNGKTWDLVEVSRPDPATPFSAAPIPLDSLNTGVSERYPWVSQDGAHILFSREAVGEPGFIYEAWR